MTKIARIYEKENTKLLKNIEQHGFAKIIAEVGIGVLGELTDFFKEKGMQLIDMNLSFGCVSPKVFSDEKTVFLYENQNEFLSAIDEFGLEAVRQKGGIMRVNPHYEFFDFNSAIFDQISFDAKPIMYRLTKAKMKKLTNH